MDAPNARERKALQVLYGSEWEFKAKLMAGEKTFASLKANGWIEPYVGNFISGERYQLTALGRAAYLQPVPQNARQKPRLKQVQPRLAALPPRLKKL